jgi:hypothetical protein
MRCVAKGYPGVRGFEPLCCAVPGGLGFVNTSTKKRLSKDLGGPIKIRVIICRLHGDSEVKKHILWVACGTDDDGRASYRNK